MSLPDVDKIEKMTHLELAEIARILDEQDRALDENKLDLYVPHNKGVDGGQLAFHKSDAMIRMIVTGNRWGKCVSGRTIIEDPITGVKRRVDEIKGHHHVWAFDESSKRVVSAIADEPFLKGKEMLYRVEFSNGGYIECTAGHRMLTDGGYKELKDLSVGSTLLDPFLKARPQSIFSSRLESSEEFGQSAHVLDGQSFLKRLLNFLGDCLSYFHFYDALLRLEAGICQYFFLQPSDARQHTFRSFHSYDFCVRKDGEESRVKHSHLYQRFSLPSNFYGLRHFLVRAFEPLFRNAYKWLRCAYESIATVAQRKSEFALQPQSNASIFRRAIQSFFSYFYPQKLHIKSIQEIGEEVYYDFTVPKYHNYLAGGVVHHNTTASVIEAIWLALGIHPYHNLPVPNRGKMYGESFPTIDETIRLKFDEWLPKKYLAKKRPFVYNQNGNLIGINFANGSIIKIGSYDQEEKKSEGSNWHYVGFDEPPPRSLYIANFRGLVDFGGLMWFSLTPLSEAWLFDDLWEPGMSGAKPFIKCISGVSSENPHLDQKSLNLYFSELTDSEREIRYYGRFTKLAGLVIDTYDHRYSDVDPFPLSDEYVVYEGIDPHPGKPHAALWKAIDREGRRYVVDELKCDEGLYAFGKKIVEKRNRLRDQGAIILRSVCDTSLNQKDPVFRMNQKDELNNLFMDLGDNLFTQNAQKKDWLEAGISKMKDLYRVIKQSDGEQKPMQFVFRSCTSYKYELNHYQWPKAVSKGSKDEMPENVRPVSKHNDLLDCDRYIESLAPAYQTPGSSLINTYSGAYQRISYNEKMFAKTNNFFRKGYHL